MPNAVKFHEKKLYSTRYERRYEIGEKFFLNTDTAGQYAYNTYTKHSMHIFEERTLRDGRKIFTVKDHSNKIRYQLKQLPNENY